MGYSADSRATVHTPKRVFVRFHFTPNYLVHTYTHARTYHIYTRARGESGRETPVKWRKRGECERKEERTVGDERGRKRENEAHEGDIVATGARGHGVKIH